MYQMPVHFGPCCGPRSDPEGRRLFEYGPQKSTQHILAYETDPKVLENYLPEGFAVRKPYVIVTHKMHRDLPWLAGRGYNVTTFQTPVTYTGREETVRGLYQLSIWENHADPIISGREQLGYSKIYAEIEDMQTLKGVGRAGLSSWGFRFVELEFDLNASPEDGETLREVLFDPENEGLMHLKYIPRSGDGFSEAEVACVTLTPKKFEVPQGLPPLPPQERTWCAGKLTWHRPRWEDMPTQYHVVQGLAALPVVRYLGASVVKLEHYNDVYHQRTLA